MTISVLPLGAGCDVGRSCVIVQIDDQAIMFDCGMHMGFQNYKRFPDFRYISKNLDPTIINKQISAVLITHFHLDHCGALPFFSQVIGYDGPIIMSQPTKAIAPILLEDFKRLLVEKKGKEVNDDDQLAPHPLLNQIFTSDDIKNCMKKVTTINVHETIKLINGLEITAYYAGHVIGAIMFKVKYNNQTVVYTGDYNMTPDRHLGAAKIDKCKPDLLITETTYATMIRDSKRARECGK